MQRDKCRLTVLAAVLAVWAVSSPAFAADSWTLWRGTTTFTDIDAGLPAEVQTKVESGLDRVSCERLKQDKLAEVRQPSRSAAEDGFIRLEPGTGGTTKVLMRYLCVRADARPGPAPWYSPGRSDPFATKAPAARTD